MENRIQKEIFGEQQIDKDSLTIPSIQIKRYNSTNSINSDKQASNITWYAIEINKFQEKKLQIAKEEAKFEINIPIIAPDCQIPNSVIRKTLCEKYKNYQKNQ